MIQQLTNHFLKRKAVKEIIMVLEKASFELRFVGGCVRKSISGENIDAKSHLLKTMGGVVSSLGVGAVRVYSNTGISQILFFRGENPKASYADKKGKYQGQTGITLAKAK